jgi:F420-non-reducing hydrogenase large subunit
VTRRITIDPITRLEGHGKIEVLLDDAGNVASAFLQVPELRGFERFCVGRPAEEMPRLTAHVCGVCPAAHHLASVRALDALYGATLPVAARRVQALYYNLFVFEDHLLHYWYMGGPDFYAGKDAPAPMRSVLGVLARVGAELGKRILSVRKEARELMAAMAGRTIHPVFAVPGGISRPLDAETVRRVREAAPRLVAFAEDTLASFLEAVLESAEWAPTLASEVFLVRCQ